MTWYEPGSGKAFDSGAPLGPCIVTADEIPDPQNLRVMSRINGELRQVLVSAREMNSAQLPSTSQTWVNQHLVYTHGYGVVVSPVNAVAPDGTISMVSGRGGYVGLVRLEDGRLNLPESRCPMNNPVGNNTK